MLHDERFSKYKVKFPEPKDLDPSLWNCSDYIEEPDSTIEDEIETPVYSDDETSSENNNIEAQTELLTPQE